MSLYRLIHLTAGGERAGQGRYFATRALACEWFTGAYMTKPRSEGLALECVDTGRRISYTEAACILEGN